MAAVDEIGCGRSGRVTTPPVGANSTAMTQRAHGAAAEQTVLTQQLSSPPV